MTDRDKFNKTYHSKQKLTKHNKTKQYKQTIKQQITTNKSDHNTTKPIETKPTNTKYLFDPPNDIYSNIWGKAVAESQMD